MHELSFGTPDPDSDHEGLGEMKTFFFINILRTVVSE